jgi:hypothetical protein
MFAKPTVFILGAGASWHYGYPTGENLVEQVIQKSRDLASFCRYSKENNNAHFPEYVRNKLMADNSAVDLDHAWQRVHDECVDLAKRLIEANPPVIDYFLGQNPRLWAIGKLMIAFVILECEAKYLQEGNINRKIVLENSPVDADRVNAKGLDVRRYKDDWCRFVLYQIVSNSRKSDDLLLNKVYFITFNYDMSLEAKLYNGLRCIELFNPEDIDSFLNQERIVHIYGKMRNNFVPDYDLTPRLDALRFLGGNVSTSPKYNRNDDLYYKDCQALLDDIYAASQNLRVISDDKGLDDSAIESASHLIEESEIIYILGYGFDENNSKRLKLDKHLKAGIGQRRRIFFTNFEDRNSINKKASRLFSDSPENFLPPKAIYESNRRIDSARSTESEQSTGYYEKSTRSVYDALERDFEW